LIQKERRTIQTACLLKETRKWQETRMNSETVTDIYNTLTKERMDNAASTLFLHFMK